MAGRIKGITIEIDGNTVGLEKALKNVNSQSRSLQGQLNDVQRLLKFNPGNVDLLTQRQKLLTGQVEATRQKLNQLKSAEKQVQNQFKQGKINEKQYQSFQREIIATEGRLNHFKGQLKDTQRELKNTGKASSRMAKDFKESFDDANRSAGNTFDRLRGAGSAATAAGAGIAAGLGLGIKAAADQQRQMAALETAFQGNTKAAKEYYKWAQQYGKETPFETADVIDATIKLKSYGIEAKNALGPIGDMAASMGKPLDQAVEAVADAQTGELERLKEFGITKQMLIDQAAKMGKDEVVNAKGQIVDQQAMNDALLALMEQRFKGSMDRQSKTLYGQLSALKDSITQIMQALGNALLPIITPIVGFIQQLIDGFNLLSEPAKRIIAIIMAIIAALGLIVGPILLLLGFLPMITAGITALFSPVGAIIAIIAAVAVAITGLIVWLTNLYNKNEAFRNFVQAAWTAISTTIQTVLSVVWSVISTVFTQIWAFVSSIVSQITAFWKQNGNTIMSAARNVWTVISTVIKTVMNIILNIMRTVWPVIKSIISTTWNTIKGVISGAVKVILNIIKFFAALFTGDWSAMWDAVKGIVSGAGKMIWSIIKGAFGIALDVLKGFGKMALSGLSRAWDSIKSSTSRAFNKVVDFIKGPLDGINLFSIGKDIIGGLIDGIKNMASRLWDTVKNIASNVTDSFKKIFKIHSPSRVMRDQIGKQLGAGLSVGMVDSVRGIGKAAQKMSQAAIPKVSDLSQSAQQTVEAEQPDSATQQGTSGGITLIIKTFINQRPEDIKQMMHEVAFYAQQEAGGGLT